MENIMISDNLKKEILNGKHESIIDFLNLIIKEDNPFFNTYISYKERLLNIQANYNQDSSKQDEYTKELYKFRYSLLNFIEQLNEKNPELIRILEEKLGYQKDLENLINKKIFLEKELILAYDSEKKFALNQQIKDAENQIANLKYVIQIDALTEEFEWQTLSSKESSIDEFDAFIKKYPNSKYVEQATEKIKISIENEEQKYTIKGKESENKKSQSNAQNDKSSKAVVINTDYKIINENVKGIIDVEKISDILSNLIDKIVDEKGLMVGIFGKWGRGKTFLWNELWSNISENKKKYHKVEFHAWKYQETPASWAYLYEAIATAYFKTGIQKVIRYFFFIIHKTLSFKILRIVLGMFIFLFTFLSFIVLLNLTLFNKNVSSLDFKTIYCKFVSSIEIVSAAIPLAGIASLFLALRNELSIKAKELIKKYTSKDSFKTYLGIQAEIEKEIEYLIKIWSHPIKEINEKNGLIKRIFYKIDAFIKQRLSLNKRILLFVDDLDRCSEDRIIQIIDALKVILENKEISKRLIIITAIDERILIRAIAHKYSSLLKDVADKDKQLENLTQEYMDKLFLLGLKLGQLNEIEKIEIFKNYTKDKIVNIQEKSISLNPDEINGQKENGSQGAVAINTVNSSETNQGTKEKANQQPTFVVSKSEILQNKAFEITKTEEDNLIFCIKSQYELTPRQIRIFYNRYQLAKNILIFSKLSEVDKLLWINIENDFGILSKLIFEFSIINNIKLLCKYKAIIECEKADNVLVNLMNSEININKTLLIALLETIEMVIPY